MIFVFGDVLIAGDAKLLSTETSDIATQELGRHLFNYGQLAKGYFPLWCPSLFCGFPSFGGMQTGLLYPLSFPFLIVSAIKAINWSFILHEFLGGMFMYLWLGRMRLHRWACLAGGLMFAFSGPFFLRIYAGHLTPNNVIAWIPLVFLAIDGMIATPSLGWFLLGTAAVSMELLAGYPQLLFYTAIAAALYTLLRIHQSPRIWRSILLLVGMNVFVVGITCVQWATGIAAANECVRAKGLPYWFAAQFSLPPESWLTLIHPGLFGDVLATLYWGRWTIWEICLYFGVIGVFFSAIGLFHGNRRFVLTAAAIVVAMGILATGSYSPHFRFFYDHVPGFNMFRGDGKFSALVVTFLIVLSAHGLDMLFRDERKRTPIGLFLGSLLACAATAGLLAAVRCSSTAQFKSLVDASLNSGEVCIRGAKELFASQQSIHAAAAVAAGELLKALCILASLAVVLGLIWWRGRWRSRLAPIVVVLVGIELLLFARHMVVSYSPAAAREAMFKAALVRPSKDRGTELKPIPDLVAFLKQNLGDGRILCPDDSNLAMYLDGVSDIWGYGPVSAIHRFAEFIAFTQGDDPDSVYGEPVFNKRLTRFDMLRCKYALLRQPDRKLVVVPIDQPSPLPRFLFISDWSIEPRRDAALRLICSEGFDPRTTIVLERAPEGWPATGGSPWNDAHGSVRVLSESTDFQEVEATLDKPAILLETDLYSPNWHVRALSGSSQSEYELIPANYVLRGIPLKAGKHRLRIEYRPIEFVVGRWVSLASLILFLGLAAAWTVRRLKFRDPDQS